MASATISPVAPPPPAVAPLRLQASRLEPEGPRRQGFLMEAPPRDDNNDDANHHPILSIRRGYRRRHCLPHNPDPAKRIRRAEGESSRSASGTDPLPQDDGSGKIDEKNATDAPPLRRASCLQSLAHGSMSVLGRRRDMEDAVTEVTGLAATAAGAGGYAYFAVYDGHGGAMVARACRDRLHVAVAEEVWRRRAAGEGEGPEMWRRALEAGFARVDAEVMEAARAMKKGMVGSTAVVAVVAEKWIVVANCGDSRAVLSRGGVAVPLSIDHKPDRPDELRRVEALGGRILCWDCPRVLGVLSTSRSFGDYLLKPYVSSDPELTVTGRTEKDEFLILASDGLWDVISSEMACRVIGKCLEVLASDGYPCGVANSAAKEAAAVLVRLAISRGSVDNISVVVVKL
ncbi:unnamed protein product [Musa acuminata subsp. burmannicoides]